MPETLQQELNKFYNIYKAIQAKEENNFNDTVQKLIEQSKVILDATKYVSELELNDDTIKNKYLLDDFLNFCNENSLIQFRERIFPTLIRSTTAYELEGAPYQSLICDAVFEAKEMFDMHMKTSVQNADLSLILSGFGYARHVVGGFSTHMVNLGINIPIDQIGEYEYQAMPVMMHDVCMHTFAMLNATQQILSLRIPYIGQQEQLTFIPQFQEYLNKWAIDIVQQFRLGEAILDFDARCVAKELIDEESVIAKVAKEKVELFRKKQEERLAKKQIKQQEVVELSSAAAPEVTLVKKTQQESSEEKLTRLSVIEDGAEITLKSINKDINNIRALVKNELKRPLSVEESIDIARRLICFVNIAQKKESIEFKNLTELSKFISDLFDLKKCKPTEEEKLSINLIKADLCSVQAMVLHKKIRVPEYDLVEVKDKEKGYLRPTNITADQIIERSDLLNQYGSVIESLKSNIEDINKTLSNIKDSESSLAASMSVDQYNMVCKAFGKVIAHHEWQDKSRQTNYEDFLGKLNLGEIPQVEKTPQEKKASESIRKASKMLVDKKLKVNYNNFKSSENQLREVCDALSKSVEDNSQPSFILHKSASVDNISSIPLADPTREARSASC